MYKKIKEALITGVMLSAPLMIMQYLRLGYIGLK